MCSELTPRAPIPDTRIPQLMQPCMEEDMDDEDHIRDNDKSEDFYNNAIHERVVKSVRSTPTKKKEIPEMKMKTELEEEISMGNRLNAQRLGVALRNLLKLPKAHKWVCFEFFYSNIDKVLFQGENDFQVCLRESLPNLSTRRLSRVEWAKVRARSDYMIYDPNTSHVAGPTIDGKTETMF